ncbi:hypothetical protein UA08_07059 [Talaromyces atroroseus]|uniref:DUF7728 domain-containing protein n=1 Tax=Talaromyces atroroseus TaxID=1441469 RepID=A0A225AQ20_TALAT|nr:hypothetical protein UA08_07059 [Talaromyces atroroseus]OKL57699.1 hypothetical protein UA08_07059 [Talaromyces atroroseus]
MLFRSLVAASALSLGASAFLVVPETDHHHNLPVAHAIELEDARTETVQLACDDCPFPETGSDGVVTWTEATRSSLDLKFRAQDGSLYVNDARIFPVSPDTVEMVKAVQRRESDGQETENLNLGFALMAFPLAPPRDDMELLQIRFSPLDIDGHPAPLDTVSITVIQTAAGELFIIQTEVELPAGQDDHDSWKNCKGDIQCVRHLVFNRIRALVRSAQAHMMNLKSKLGLGIGCHGKPQAPPHHKPGHHRQGAGKFAEDDHEGDHEGHGHPHPHHHHNHGLRRTLFHIVRFILAPAILGILAGLTASAIGMLFGQAIVFLWMRYRRATSSRSTSSLEQGSASEKAVLMEEDLNEELPPYTDDDHAHAEYTDAK